MSLAAAIKPKGPGLGGGWLSMAPQMDDEPSATSSITTNLDSSTYEPAKSTHTTQFTGYQQRRPCITSTAPRRLLPRTAARFMVGDSSALATPASPAPESPYSGESVIDSPPPFDVRSSFAPMPRWGAPVEAKDEEDKNLASSATSSSGVKLQRATLGLDELMEEDDPAGSNSPDEEKGILHNGIQWKGKTAHAVEQEMEALGDRTVMSYAPDAVYLASRLEGLKRNLEVGGDRLKRWAWEDDLDDEERLEMEEREVERGEQMKRSSSPFAIQKEPLKDNINMPMLEKDNNFSLSSSLNISEGITPSDEVFDDPMQVSTSIITVTSTEGEMQVVPNVPSINIDASAAKAAALDARVEVRTLRRPDLEQVRELHCYQGDGEKVDTETYNTSAGFLLRLLVDEHHVCLVAVAKPLPEPPSLPSRFSPGAPPPSLDMPPSKSPFLIAGQSRHAANPLLRKSLLHPYSRLAPLAHSSETLVEATAPRSFGVGADSSSSAGDDEESSLQNNLFEAAKNASAERSRTASSSGLLAEIDEEHQMDVQEKDEEEVHAAASTRSASPDSQSYNVLAGPTHDVAPPRAIRIMGAPPLNRMPTDSETVLGVASARIKVVQRSETDDAFGKSEALDSSWPGLDPQGQKSTVTREAHIISLSILPGERSQGLGARLLDRLLDECKRRTAGPRMHQSSSNNPSQDPDLAPRIHENAPMRTFLEVHPTNTFAINLYKSRNFTQVEGTKGIIKHYFRGDNRIPNHIRVKVGGSDAIRLERFDYK